MRVFNAQDRHGGPDLVLASRHPELCSTSMNPPFPLHRILRMLSSARRVVPQRSSLLPGVVGAPIVLIALFFSNLHFSLLEDETLNGVALITTTPLTEARLLSSETLKG